MDTIAMTRSIPTGNRTVLTIHWNWAKVQVDEHGDEFLMQTWRAFSAMQTWRVFYCFEQ
jgi:hypothetical protein